MKITKKAEVLADGENKIDDGSFVGFVIPTEVSKVPFITKSIIPAYDEIINDIAKDN